MQASPQRIDWLDSLRGLAALSVLLGHSIIFCWPAMMLNTINFPFVHLMFDGRAAVAMFFVLSGFVLARPYLSGESQHPPKKLHLAAFYLRRFTRIWPPWLFAFALSALAQATIFRSWTSNPPTNQWFGGFWHQPLTFWNFVRQCFFNLHDAHILLLPQDWSLGVELKASALLPLFILLSTTLFPWALLATAGIIFYIFPTGHYYISFIMGVLLARHWKLTRWLAIRPFSVKLALLFIGLFFYQTSHCGENLLGKPAQAKYFWLGTSLGCVFILLASLTSRRIQAALNLSPVVFLGRISYSVYLLQFVVIMCLLPPWVCWLNSMGVQHTLWLFPLVLLGSVGGTILASTMSYLWIEVPCIKLGHWLSRQIQKQSGVKRPNF